LLGQRRFADPTASPFLARASISKGKKSNFPPQLWRAFIFPPQTIKPEIFPPPTLKTVRFTSRTGFGRWFYYSNIGFATVTAVLSFLIYFG
jgi:hypothetical protein